jgi:hypothetical protein
LICKSFVSRSAKRIETNSPRIAARKHHEQTNRNSGSSKISEQAPVIVFALHHWQDFTGNPKLPREARSRRSS